MMGPNYRDSERYEAKMQQLEDEELDEKYCFLYVPQDAAHQNFKLGQDQSGPGSISNATVETTQGSSSDSSRSSTSGNGMTFTHLKVKEIRNYMYEIYAEELFKIIDINEFVKSEIENKGIVVIDEIDKLVRSSDAGSTTKASDEGVQYDLLPILDGTVVNVNNKMKIDTRNILFVCAGAFEKVKPTELAIELQGRLPVSAQMESLTKEDFFHILRSTKYNLLAQSIALLKTERVNLVFDTDAIQEMAQVSQELNEEDNIGARRLRTVLDALLHDLNFEAPDFEQRDAYILITKEYVRETAKPLYQNRDFKKYLM